MEEKQLDFNAPLLSVRRFSSFSSTSASSERNDSERIENSWPTISSLPYYKPDIKSGPIKNAGSIPFLWEQTPGRPKDGGGPRAQPLKRPPLAPKLPPGRVLDVRQQPTNSESNDKNAVSPKNVVSSKTSNAFLSSHRASSLSDNVTELDSSKEIVKKGQDAETEEDEDETFTDALDTLSRTESFFLNCSISGVSGLDGPDIKPSGTFSTDPQTRDFMMGRFLPAAKAVAADTPQYASRKQPLAREHSRQVTKVVNGERRNPINQYRPNLLPQYTHDVVEEESEDEEDGDEYDDTGNLSAKACGLLPRFCLKNSVFLLNPVPGMKIRARAPMSSVGNVRTRAKTAYAGTCTNKDEHTWDAFCKHKFVRELKPPGLLEDESKMTSESNQLTDWSDSQTPEGSSPYRLSAGVGISPYRNEAPQSPFHEGSGFLGIPKEVKNYKASRFDSSKTGRNNFRETLSRHSSKPGSGPLSPMVEKTLYVDSVQMVETPNSNSSSSDMRGFIDITDKDSEVLAESKGVDETLSVESCLRIVEDLKISKEIGIFQPKIQEVDSDFPSSSDRSTPRWNVDRVESFRQDGGLDQESRPLVFSEIPDDRKLNFNDPQPLDSVDQGNFYAISLPSPLPPPLPKSPSESWLGRTLSISSRNPSLRSYQVTQSHLKKQGSKISSDSPKWETIVKTSNVHLEHSRFSQELIIPASRQSES
ncbi:uncharacterized protein LOC122651777 isoform X2 [Telopea speciosissima]|uniref:uncharacterized protein LOC122651777 isoform X2 n=1 Tax=Telopea speciosissima TaxID=54955 RepID=UPI001CC6CB12|nr:uncharacterized protein LOC122651777 isoform X2 [Telopea speciosissima]